MDYSQLSMHPVWISGKEVEKFLMNFSYGLKRYIEKLPVVLSRPDDLLPYDIVIDVLKGRQVAFPTGPKSEKPRPGLYKVYTHSLHRLLFFVKTTPDDYTRNVYLWPHYSFPALYPEMDE